MRSPNGSNHTTQTPPPLSFYNTFKMYALCGRTAGSHFYTNPEHCFEFMAYYFCKKGK